MNEPLAWDDLFMNMAYLAAMKSKDESTHIGAVIVGPDNELRSMGYNSFPRNIDDDVPERQERPEKYDWMAHAERNSVYNAARVGIPLKGCKVYTPGFPCTGCSIAIIQTGIEEVITDAAWESHDQWAEQHVKSMQMLMEAGVKTRLWHGDLVQIERFKRGEKF